MTRREVITLLGGAAAWPLAASAQQSGKIPRVGYIRPQDNDAYREEIVRAMRDLGYVEGRNIAYEFRYYGDDVEAISSHVSDLLRVKVDIIVAGSICGPRCAGSDTEYPHRHGGGRSVGRRLDRRSSAPGRQHNGALRPVHGTDGEAPRTTERGRSEE